MIKVTKTLYRETESKTNQANTTKSKQPKLTTQYTIFCLQTCIHEISSSPPYPQQRPGYDNLDQAVPSRRHDSSIVVLCRPSAR